MLLGALTPPGQPDNTRQSAIRGLCNLASHSGNIRAMWDDAEGVRRIFIDAAAVGQSDSQRERALDALAAFSAVPELAQPMWAHEPTTSVLVAAAAPGEPDQRRNPAIRALANLADDAANAQTVWTSSDGVRAVLIAAASPTERNEWAQAYAVRALSKCPLRYRNVGNYNAEITERMLRPLHKGDGGSRFDHDEEWSTDK